MPTDDTSIWMLAQPHEPVVLGTFVNGVFVPLDAVPDRETESLGPRDPLPIVWNEASHFPLPGAVEVTDAITVHFEDDPLHPQANTTLTLREVVERLGYDLTEEMDRILGENPHGPWPLEDLEAMFGPSGGDYQDENMNAACAARFPHKVSFEPWPVIEEGDEDTRL